ANQAARIEKLRGLGTEIVGEEASAAKTAEWHRNRLAAVACFVLRKTNRLEDLRVEAETRGENDLKLLIDGLIERAGK
ncbi:MAG: hypothetical protein Q7R60_03200, partial [bacterium]|nr:hypothetical protein [bacterium]